MKELIINKIKRKRLTKIIYSINNKSQTTVLVYSFKKGKNSVSGHNIDNDTVIDIPLDSVVDVIPMYRNHKRELNEEKLGRK